MNQYKYRIIITILMICCSFGSYVQGQQKQQKKKSKSSEVEIKFQLLNESGDPVPNASITIGEGLIQAFSDSEGMFSIKGTYSSTLIITAKGYKELVVKIASDGLKKSYTMESDLLFDSYSDQIQLPTGLQTSQRKLVGSVSKINGAELESQPDIVFSNALQGRLAGLTVRMSSGGLASNNPQLYVRGLGREDGNGALTIVDGIERPIDFLSAEEIESVEVLKDATAKILYGSRAANGVILITTKRGKANTRVIKSSVEYGVSMATKMPEYLNSAEYATLYNEARGNDGLPPFYSAQDLEGYRNSTGVNDLRYPNADYLDYFLRSSTPFRKANLEYSGGTQETRYAFMVGYIGSEGLEKIGTTPTHDRVNVRGNLDFQVTPSLKAFIDGNGIIADRKWGKVNNIFSSTSSHRPNEYPFVIRDSNFDGEVTEVGVERIAPLGGSYKYPQSLYGDMVYGGFREEQSFFGQTNFGLDLKMDKVLKGLSAKTVFTFDNYQVQSANQINNPIRYALNNVVGSNGEDSIAYAQLNGRVISGDRSEQNNNFNRNIGWISTLSYFSSFGNHSIGHDLSHFYYLNESSNRRQNIENTNSFLRTVYSFKNKIYLEATGAIMGSNRFAKEQRFKFFPSVGAGWILSDETFLKGVKTLDFLKVKGSYGVLGYDASTSFYLYETRFLNSGNAQFHERNQNGVPRTGFDNYGNPDLTWEMSKEVNIGVEGFALDHSVLFEFNYFNEYRSNIIFDNPNSIYSSVNGNLNMPHNLGEVSNRGLEGSVTYLKSHGNFNYSIGGNFLYVKNRIERTNEVEHPDQYLRATGLPTDAIFGYVSNGIFRSQSEVDAAPFQALGPYGIGNLAYEDLNNSGTVDERDQKMIGNTFPRTTVGVNLNLNYKRFGLFVLGTSELGVNKMLNNSYYRMQAEDKYSAFARNRFHPINNPEGTSPALTSLNAVNDFRGSTFWMEDASFFRLRNIELSYSILRPQWALKNIRIYARGTNLFVISRIKELDPEVTSGGVSNYPVFRTLTGGVALSF